jgi:hypothetical protein
LLDGTIAIVTKDGKIGCKISYSSVWDYKKLESTTAISYITQLFDGTIVAVTSDGKIACKTSYTSEWDFNKLLSPGNVNHLIQLQDGTIAVVINGKIACKTSYDSEWDFDKIKTTFPIDDYRKIAKNLLIQGQQTVPKTFTFTNIGQIIQLQDGTIIINNAVGKFDILDYTVYYINAAKTNYNSEWNFEKFPDGNIWPSFNDITQFNDGTICAVFGSKIGCKSSISESKWDYNKISQRMFQFKQIIEIKYKIENYQRYYKRENYIGIF